MRACTKCGETKPLEAFPPVRRGEEKRQTWCRECFAEANAKNYRKNHEREKARLIRQVEARRTDVRQRIVEYLLEHPCVDCGETDIVVLEFDHVRDKVANIATYANGGRSWERVKAEIDKCEVRCANCHRLKTLERSRRSTHLPLPRSQRTPTVQLEIEASLGIRACRVCGNTKSLSEFPFRSVQRQTRQWICLLCQREYTKAWYGRNRRRQIANAQIRRDGFARELRRRVLEYLRTHPCVDCGETNPNVLDFDHLRDKRANVSELAHRAVSWNLLLAEIEKCEVRCANCHRRKTGRDIGSYRSKWSPTATRAGLEPAALTFVV
jgi:hypothetical protein